MALTENRHLHLHMEKLPQPQGDGSDLLRGKAMTTKIAPSLSQHCWLLCENREEIVAKVREDMDSLSGRVSLVEQNMDTHVANTTKLLEAMTDRRVDERQESVLQRLELLEGKFAKADFSLPSTRTSDSDEGELETCPCGRRLRC